jgi:hypothetical protein
MRFIRRCPNGSVLAVVATGVYINSNFDDEQETETTTTTTTTTMTTTTTPCTTG